MTESANFNQASQGSPEEQAGRINRSTRKKSCLTCSKLIPADAIKCRYCGTFIDEPMMSKPKPVPKNTSACLIVIIVGIASLFFLFIIAAIAIPNLLESKKAANEAAAISALRMISSSEELLVHPVNWCLRG